MDYTPYLPPYDNQHSPTGADAFDCVSEACTHAIEIQNIIQGGFVRYSPRALGKMSGTTPSGNNIGTVFDTVQKKGLVPYELWPNLDTFTWEQYYATIPDNILSTSADFLKHWNVSLDTTHADLAKGPVILQLQLQTTTHFVVQINEHQYFDSYQPAVKELDPSLIRGRYQITLTPKKMNQAKVFKAKNSATVYVGYPMPSMEYLKEKGSLEGFEIPVNIPDSDSLT